MNHTESAILVVQQVTVIWTKTTRSAPEATVRNALPTAYPITLFPAPESFPAQALLIEKIYLHERDQFRHSQREHTLQEMQSGKSYTVDNVRIRTDGEHVIVVYAYQSWSGAPRRQAPPRQIMTVQPGEWGEISYNGRTGGYDGWYYHQTTLNIGCFQTLPEDPFTQPPTHTYSDMADLW